MTLKRLDAAAQASRRLAVAAIPLAAIFLSGCADQTETGQSHIVSAIDGPVPQPTLDKSEIAFADGGDRVLFDYDKATIRPDALPILQHAADWLKSHPGSRFVIEGHADESGTREYNLALGARRANTVKATLASLGVPAQQIAQTISYGKERPAVVGSTEAAWAQNRRA